MSKFIRRFWAGQFWLANRIANLERNQENIMSTLDDLKAAQAVSDQKVSAVSTDVAALQAKLAAIPTQGMTPDQQAALDDAVAHAGRINDALSAVDAAANAAPAEAPVAAPAPDAP